MRPCTGKVDTIRERSASGVRARRIGESGLTLIEVMIAFSAFIVTLLAFSKVIVGSMAATTTNHETSIANEAARAMVETLQATDFEDVFALYNDHDGDDPVPGAAPGKDFAVAGLDPLRDDPDGFAGEILFPTEGAALPGYLNENLQDKRFGCPRDLNGDGDSLDELAAGEYGLVPVVVRIEWRGAAGPSRVELRILLANY